MRQVSTKVEPLAEPGDTSSGRIALVASADPLTGIEEVLERNELAFDRFESLEDLLDVAAARLEPGLTLLWFENSGPAVARSIELVTRHHPRAPVVVVCASLERWGVRSALAAGAAGIVAAADIASALSPCVSAVHAGQTCVPRQHDRQIDPPVLSTREKQILGLVVMGFTNGQIAQQLFLAESTVKSHLSSAFGKLGVRSRNEAVSLILDTDRGLGTGILAVVGEPTEAIPTMTA